MMRADRADPPAEAGVTLVELIVYLAVGAIILSLMAGLLINGLSSQAQTTDRDTATGRAAVVTNSLQTSIRNAVGFSPASGATNTVVAVVATGASSWQCRAWALTNGGDLVYKSDDDKFDTTSTSGWTVLASGVTGLFSGKAFSASSSTQLQYRFTVTVGGASVPITGGVIAQSAGSGPSCW